jgi:hypothetical protein
VPYYIYELVDPRTDQIRYVGITNNPELRLYQHTNCIDATGVKLAWLEEMRNDRVKPIMRIIETTDSKQQAEAQEKHWIQEFIKSGFDLVNVRYGNVPQQQRSHYTHFVGQLGPTDDPFRWTSPGWSHEDEQRLEEKYKGLSEVECFNHPDYLDDTWNMAQKAGVWIHAFTIGFYYGGLSKEADKALKIWYQEKCKQLNTQPFDSILA